ncbi:MAG: biotin/lipoyl-binding protein [Nitrososphaerota archaeon]|nr:biotin/lipoyl-binding protein [Nitrososphaerota archaeon]MDG7043116.1 biotin/lipoyl-binding protein [Nitrososphaerota archaeon]
MKRYEFLSEQGPITLYVGRKGDRFRIKLGGKAMGIKIENATEPGTFLVHLDDRTLSVSILRLLPSKVSILIDGEEMTFQRVDSGALVSRPTRQLAPALETLRSPLPGRVTRVMVGKGDHIKPGQALLVVESMKMESILRGEREAIVKDILVSEGDTVNNGQVLIEMLGVQGKL